MTIKTGITKAPELCKVCNKPVDPMERLEVPNFGIYHTSCFRCDFCSRILGVQEMCLSKNDVLCSFCKPNLEVFFGKVPFSTNKQGTPKLKRSFLSK